MLDLFSCATTFQPKKVIDNLFQKTHPTSFQVSKLFTRASLQAKGKECWLFFSVAVLVAKWGVIVPGIPILDTLETGGENKKAWDRMLVALLVIGRRMEDAVFYE